MTQKTQSLKPCPFCGKAMIAPTDDFDAFKHPSGPRCFLSGMHFDADEIDRWNTRAEASQ